MYNSELYASNDIISAIKPKQLQWAGHVPRMGIERGVCIYRVLVCFSVREKEEICLKLTVPPFWF